MDTSYQSLENSPYMGETHPSIYAAKAHDFILLLAEGLPSIQALQEAGLPSPTKPHARFLLSIPSLALLYETHRQSYELLEAKLTPTSLRVQLEALDQLALAAKKLDLSLDIKKELAKLFNLYPVPTPSTQQPLPVNITVIGVPSITPQHARDNLALDTQNAPNKGLLN